MGIDMFNKWRHEYYKMNCVDDQQTLNQARELVAQCWCDPRVSDRDMDVELAEVFAELLCKESQQ